MANAGIKEEVEVEVEVNAEKWTVLRWNEVQKDGETARSSEVRKDSRNETRTTQDGDGDIESPYANTGSADTSNDASARSLGIRDKQENPDEWVVQTANNDVVKVPCVNATPSDKYDLCAQYSKRSLGNEARIIQMRSNNSQCTSIESDVSDDISVITESGTDVDDKNLLQICELERKYIQLLEESTNRQTDLIYMVFIVLLVMFILMINSFYTIHKVCPNEIDIGSIKTESCNITDAYKELKEVHAMLNEIKAHISVKDKIYTKDVWQLLKSIKRSKNINNESIVEPFDSIPSHYMDQLHVSLNILSSLAGEIQENNKRLNNEINKTLDIVNNTKAFYETLMLFNNNTQNTDNSVVTQFLQSARNKIRYTSQSLFSDLAEKLSKITSNVHNKFNKMKHKLSKKLCHLLPDDNEFLKQLTENSQLLRDYNKFCLSNDKSKKFNGKTKEDTKVNDIKRQTRKSDVDPTLHSDGKRNWKIDNDRSINPDDGEDYLSIEVQSCGISEDTSDDCPKFNTNTPTFDTVSKHKTEIYTVNFNGKKDTIYAENPRAEKIYETKAKKPKQEDSFEFDGSIKKIFNDKDIKRENIYSQNKMDRVKSTDNYRKSKHFSSNDYTTKQNQQKKSGDWQFERSQAREEQRQIQL